MKIDKPVLREYPYRLGRGTSVALTALMVSSVVVVGVLAVYLDRGANLKGIELSPGQFRTLLGGLAVLSVLVSLPLMAWLLVDSFTGTRRIAFTRDSVILPRPSRSGMSKDEVELPFGEILVVRLAPYIGKTQVIQVVYDNGILMIPGNMLRRADFIEVGEHLYSVAHERTTEAEDE